MDFKKQPELLNKRKKFCRISHYNYSGPILKKDIMLTKHKFHVLPQMKNPKLSDCIDLNDTSAKILIL